jgi:16S rRNA (cytosine967-C5)-methyltransferase
VIDSGSHAVFESGPMKRGALQVMDVGSQLLVRACGVEPGMRVVDACAGAGGKTLFLADLVGPEGVVEAHDLSLRRLEDARKRVRALKLTNVRFAAEPDYAKADVILIDAPCSGTGRLAVEPDQKWKRIEKDITEFARKQRELVRTIVDRARPGAVIVYGTCSLLREENEAIVEEVAAAGACTLQSVAGLVPAENVSSDYALRVWPHRAKGSGFFGARLRKT